MGKNREAPTELVLTQADRFAGGDLLVVDVPSADDLRMLTEAAQGVPITPFFTSDALRRNVAPSAGFGVAPEDGLWDRILVYLPRTRERILWLARRLGSNLRPGGEVLVVGGNSEGIRSLRKALEPHFEQVHKVESARHCQLLSASGLRDPVHPDPVDTVHIALDATPGLKGIALARAPGVFSAGRIDAGTALLLAHLPAEQEGRVVDMGCGAGVFAAVALQRWPSVRVVACDADAFALAATRGTLAAAEPSGERWEVRAADAWEGVEGRFDLILCNAPFHQGVATEYGTGERMARGAAEALAPGGRALFVCNRFLQVPEWLKAGFRKVEVLEDDGRYLVLRARSPRPAHQRRRT